MTAPELKDHLLRQIGITVPGSTPTWNHNDVATAVNRAFQVLWLDLPVGQRDHYTKTTHDVTLIAGQDTYELPDWIQSVLSPVYYANNKSQGLKEVTSDWEINNFAKILPSCTGGSGAPGGNKATRFRPQAFYHDRQSNIGDGTNEGVASSITVAPTPALTETITLEVERECPNFSASDFCDEDNPTEVPIPHQYIESILLPIATYFMSLTLWMDIRRKDLIPIFKEEYVLALQRAGRTDPQLDILPD